MAYQQENLFAIQKFHTVLGLIYAERNQWTSEWAPGNAIFQLRHALDVAQKRARVEKKDFQPLPHLHRLLADGYLLVEKVNLARIEYMEAMKGYLDIDSLDNAAKTYDRLEPLLENAPDTEVQKAVALNKILLVRLSISQWSREDIEQKSKMDYENAAFFGWVKDNAFKSKQHSFINRQCFKALADAGTIAIQVGEPAAASHFYHVAYGVINKEDVLASMNDVSRLSKITSVLSESPDWGKKQVFVVTDFDLKANPSYKDGKIWSLMATEQLGCSMQVGITQTFAKEIK
ncbi:MAG: hypothetical protein GTO45_37555 [Candidatus Aminicenantes bacterium]|nr:hypothetical protein [Candidatus Aminicenantes bacterium]NIM80313.1 hypothetical protein [Candidatus Aminicenantes bacterium]NIN23859.1 hypothetical protein [Candidatus Aminicenantes bacterium]NIN47575.1 hypothetical protein [Candidatus Aminicenantes bacterium]NIN90495.1 hypothetical protein [Candidatus Aminicenantes bacterium]